MKILIFMDIKKRLSALKPTPSVVEPYGMSFDLSFLFFSLTSRAIGDSFMKPSFECTRGAS